MGYLSNINRQYIITFFHALIPAYVIERLFWQQRGMNMQMVVYCEIIYAVTVILFEIPSGILADRFGRKKLLVIDGILSALEFLLLLVASKFWLFAIVMILSGIGKAFSSGSQNALLYDSLLAENKQENFEKLVGRLSAIDFIGLLIAAISGSILANYMGFVFNYIISFFSMLIAFIVSLTLKEPPMIIRPESELTGMKQYAKQSFTFIKSRPLIMLYCLTGAILGACQIYLDEFWQLILDEIRFPVIFFGFFSAIVFTFRIPGNLFAHKLKGRFTYSAILNVVILVNVIGYIAICFTRNLFCLIPMILVSLASGIMDPLIAGYLHHNVKSCIRATVESFTSLGLRLISIAVGLIFGYIGTKFSIFIGFGFLGVICLIYLLFFILKSRHKD